jgi:hypothetical protein
LILGEEFHDRDDHNHAADQETEFFLQFLQFEKGPQQFIGSHDVAFPVAPMRINPEKRPPAALISEMYPHVQPFNVRSAAINSQYFTREYNFTAQRFWGQVLSCARHSRCANLLLSLGKQRPAT